MQFNKSTLTKACAIALLSAPGLALAQATEPATPIVTAITAVGVSVALIGAAVTLVIVGIKVYKWMRRAM